MATAVGFLTTVIDSLATVEKEEIDRRKSHDKNFLSVKEAARLLNVSDLSVRNYIKRGYIKAERLGYAIRIKKHEFDNALKEVKSLKYKR